MKYIAPITILILMAILTGYFQAWTHDNSETIAQLRYEHTESNSQEYMPPGEE